MYLVCILTNLHFAMLEKVQDESRRLDSRMYSRVLPLRHPTCRICCMIKGPTGGACGGGCCSTTRLAQLHAVLSGKLEQVLLRASSSGPRGKVSDGLVYK